MTRDSLNTPLSCPEKGGLTGRGEGIENCHVTTKQLLKVS